MTKNYLPWCGRSGHGKAQFCYAGFGNLPLQVQIPWGGGGSLTLSNDCHGSVFTHQCYHNTTMFYIFLKLPRRQYFQRISSASRANVQSSPALLFTSSLALLFSAVFFCVLYYFSIFFNFSVCHLLLWLGPTFVLYSFPWSVSGRQVSVVTCVVS
jgi:hypothetical protein